MAARLLVTDDSADMRESMRLLLERAGYQVTLAENGQHAFELHQRQAADLLITDIFMPEADGLETIALFKRKFPRVRIVAMSGGGVRVTGAGNYLQTAAAAGADAVLEKPFDTGALLDLVRSLVPAA
jgi:CheY-like chemotaxis protein